MAAKSAYLEIRAHRSERGGDASSGILQASQQYHEAGYLLVALRYPNRRDLRAGKNHAEIKPGTSKGSIKPKANGFINQLLGRFCGRGVRAAPPSVSQTQQDGCI